ncbi:MAG: hypothetical protein E6K76_04655 [Candidatus Eisenbacteria bacterium]|uniref:ATP-grasp domain-containing protein n=1 Tax=Eiseniibacteriota bacterium TaxID=2212470 RepID=A0A538T6U3_UNCEI|nr:MAG: hypothetical protein E6K76_04655 [Candidatus Eisenbacteria bacterium]
MKTRLGQGILVALYRRPSYSPLQHRINDTAVLDETVSHLAAKGWDVVTTNEAEVEQGRIPGGRLYLNMCQGPLASEYLLPLENDGALIVNKASSVLHCHRHRMARLLQESRVAFPETLIIQSSDPAHERDRRLDFCGRHPRVWVKRGDVHAERPEDVVSVASGSVSGIMASFAARGVPWVAIQEHVPGPVIKFYGIRDGSYFRWYPAERRAGPFEGLVGSGTLRGLAFEAAAVLGLDVFGGDAVLPSPDRPVLIDMNDWPSFAALRSEAAPAIATYVDHRANPGESE